MNLDEQQDLIKETKEFVDKILNLGKRKGPSAFIGSLPKEKPVKKRNEVEPTKTLLKTEEENKTDKK